MPLKGSLMKLPAPVFHLKRTAKILSRTENIPLHLARDQLAMAEGFQSWSHLVSCYKELSPAKKVMSQMKPSDLVLLAARPRQGKTLLGLEIAALAAQAEIKSYFFTLDATEIDVMTGLKSLSVDIEPMKGYFNLDTSDEICAKYIMGQLKNIEKGTVVIIDYLQILDQMDHKPKLADQISSIKGFAEKSGCIFIFLTQIDRQFVLRADAHPSLSDIRLPNPLDLSLFSKACFLHEGKIRIGRVH